MFIFLSLLQSNYLKHSGPEEVEFYYLPVAIKSKIIMHVRIDPLRGAHAAGLHVKFVGANKNQQRVSKHSIGKVSFH